MAKFIQVTKDFAKDNGIAEEQVIRDIRSGSREGFQEKGIWYVRLAIEEKTEEVKNEQEAGRGSEWSGARESAIAGGVGQESAVDRGANDLIGGHDTSHHANEKVRLVDNVALRRQFPVLRVLSVVTQLVGILLLGVGGYFWAWEGLVEPNMPQHSFGVEDAAQLAGGVLLQFFGILSLVIGEVIKVFLAIEENTRACAIRAARGNAHC